MKVRDERTGWRDQALSQRHRFWGWDCPAVDLDFLFLEYDRGKATALVEYKNEHAGPQRASHPTYQALIDLGTRANIPVFAVRYSDDFSWWRVIPLNSVAKKHLSNRAEMTEKQYVEFLYKMRGYSVPKDVLDGLEIAI
jgi:hypothetical protein